MYSLRIEAVGDNWRYLARMSQAGRVRHLARRDWLNLIRYGDKRHAPWVAQIIDGSTQFIQAVREYRDADRLGERGIYCHYYLFDGLYEMNEPTGLGRSRRYWLRVTGTTAMETNDG